MKKFMNKSFGRMMAALLVVLMVASLLPVSVFAAAPVGAGTKGSTAFTQPEEPVTATPAAPVTQTVAAAKDGATVYFKAAENLVYSAAESSGLLLPVSQDLLTLADGATYPSGTVYYKYDYTPAGGGEVTGVSAWEALAANAYPQASGAGSYVVYIYVAADGTAPEATTAETEKHNVSIALAKDETITFAAKNGETALSSAADTPTAIDVKLQDDGSVVSQALATEITVTTTDASFPSGFLQWNWELLDATGAEVASASGTYDKGDGSASNSISLDVTNLSAAACGKYTIQVEVKNLQKGSLDARVHDQSG